MPETSLWPPRWCGRVATHIQAGLLCGLQRSRLEVRPEPQEVIFAATPSMLRLHLPFDQRHPALSVRRARYISPQVRPRQGRQPSPG